MEPVQVTLIKLYLIESTFPFRPVYARSRHSWEDPPIHEFSRRPQGARALDAAIFVLLDQHFGGSTGMLDAETAIPWDNSQCMGR